MSDEILVCAIWTLSCRVCCYSSWSVVQVGDTVTFNHDLYGYGEGLVIGSRTEYPSVCNSCNRSSYLILRCITAKGRQVFEIEVNPGIVRSVWYVSINNIRVLYVKLAPQQVPVCKTDSPRIAVHSTSCQKDHCWTKDYLVERT